MWPVVIVALATIAALALRKTRWADLSLRVSRIAYAALIVLALLYFPMRGGWRIGAPVCQWTFDLALARHSLTNYPHMILFLLFFLLTYAQMRQVPKAMLWTAVVCMAMGLFVELAQGATGVGHCRMRDLIPDAAGMLGGAAVVGLMRLRR